MSSPVSVEEADVFAISHEAGQFCAAGVLLPRLSELGQRRLSPAGRRIAAGSRGARGVPRPVLRRSPATRLISISHELAERELIEEALVGAGRIPCPYPDAAARRKKELVGHALTNAREALGRQLAEGATQKTLLEGVATLFRLDDPPRRIEVYDNSHISGTNAVGAMIVAGEEGLSKKHYRTFNIKSTDIAPGDDFGMMREVLTRRFMRVLPMRARSIVTTTNPACPTGRTWCSSTAARGS